LPDNLGRGKAGCAVAGIKDDFEGYFTVSGEESYQMVYIIGKNGMMDDISSANRSVALS
jgi:hypothetical protein